MRRQEVSGKIITNFCFSLAQSNNSMPQILKHLMLQRIASNHALFRPEAPLTAQIIFGPSPLWSASLRDESLFEYSRSSNLYVSEKKIKVAWAGIPRSKAHRLHHCPYGGFRCNDINYNGREREREKRAFSLPPYPLPVLTQANSAFHYTSVPIEQLERNP